MSEVGIPANGIKFDCPCCQKHCETDKFPFTCPNPDCNAEIQLCDTKQEAEAMINDNVYADKAKAKNNNGWVVGICDTPRGQCPKPRKILPINN